MMRELNALKQQMASLQQLMQLQTEMQTDIQRAIRQEVSAAINASADERSHPPTGISLGWKPLPAARRIVIYANRTSPIAQRCVL